MEQRNYHSHLPGLACALAFAAFLLLGSLPIYSQSRPSTLPSDSKSASDKDDLGSDIGSHQREILARLALTRDKKLYDENLARARETAEIASQLLDSYQTKQSLSKDDHKKFERMEKLARRIRNEAGGTETDVEIEIPSVMEAALKHVAEMADDLRKEVEKTPRHVISTSVIDQANKLIGLIQHMRDLAR